MSEGSLNTCLTRARVRKLPPCPPLPCPVIPLRVGAGLPSRCLLCPPSRRMKDTEYAIKSLKVAEEALLELVRVHM